MSDGVMPDASVVVARDADGLVALLSADFPAHGGEYLFLPGGRREDGESPLECARRELREEAGVTAESWHPLGSYVMTLGSTARIHLFEARGLTCGPQELTPTEVDFKLMCGASAMRWWPQKKAASSCPPGRWPSGWPTGLQPHRPSL
ncbi:NUDIX domain-containing protein [Streptomyces sp. NPDC102274]|uniref:NUDIX domain-containing protein n=1 Tax=Streptomyces sp. NPDC102274 TaxID=3366151 RepID=UPI00380AC7E5